MNAKEIMVRLAAPFSPDEIEWRIGSTNKDKTKGLALAYVSNRAVMNRLDETVGIENWRNEFIELGQVSKKTNSDPFVKNAKICRLWIRIDGEWIAKEDGSEDSDIEATKGGLSGAMKRAAVQWGIGRYLYKLPAIWIKIKLQGKSYVPDEIPRLPNWALPIGIQQQSPHNTFEVPEKIEPDKIFKLSADVERCVEAFSKFGIKKEHLENYLSKEAWTFDKTDLETLRNVYTQINSGKAVDDFFRIKTEPQKQSAKNLQRKLSTIET